MSLLKKNIPMSFIATVAAAAFLVTGCSSMGGDSSKSSAAPGITQLSGAQEVPPVRTEASGQSTIKVGEDKSVSGMVLVSRIDATAAHIHEAPKGANGPVILPLTKTSDTTFVVPADAKLTDAQYASYKAGKLYINVHSAAHPGGEIRGQLNPK